MQGHTPHYCLVWELVLWKSDSNMHHFPPQLELVSGRRQQYGTSDERERTNSQVCLDNILHLLCIHHNGTLIVMRNVFYCCTFVLASRAVDDIICDIIVSVILPCVL